MTRSPILLRATGPILALIFSGSSAQSHNAHPPAWTTPRGYQLPEELARQEIEAAANRTPVEDWTLVLASVRRPTLQPFWPQAKMDNQWLPVSFGAAVAAPGNGPLLIASFSPFKPRVRFYNNATHFFVESDSMPDAVLMPNPMVGITAWQQQLPHPVGYFGNVTNPESATGSLGFGQPNVWRIPLVPVAAASPVTLTGNFLRGAVALGANGIPIFNPRNNTGQFSQAIGELDAYGGHCGRADDYHYHIAPTHLYTVLTPDQPCAWALDGYPIYGYVEPDGSALQTLDTDGGHDHGGWGYHYHARGTYNAATSKWTPSNPYLMNAMHGTVVNFGGQIDPQPTASSIAPAGAPLAGAVITGFTRSGTDSWVMTYTVGGTPYSVTTSVNRIAHTVTVNQQSPTDPAGTPATYTNAGRFSYYPLSGPSMLKLPDTGQILNATATFGEDSDYTINAPSFTNNGNGTVTDNHTGLMWQKTDSGEMTWDTARTTATALTLAGFTDWRLPTAQEAFCILNHERNPSLDPTYFVESAGGQPPYFWTSDLFYGDNTKVWCTNSGGGLGPHAKTATVSAGGTNRHLSRYVRNAKPTIGHNYCNNNDGTVTDLDTGLMWTQAPSPALTWNSALNYAEALTTADFTDWRLPNIKELQSLVDIPRAVAASATTAPCLNRTLFPSVTGTALWSSTAVKSGTPTQAWLVDFGVTTTSNPSRNQQGIVSYEPFTSTYPMLAVRSAAKAGVTRSISQGLATTTIANLFPAGQRVAGVGISTATDGTTWTVPSATQFTTGAKASDLYNEASGFTPANIGAVDLNAVPVVTVDADGEVITGYLFADNYFELYVNGTLVAVDPVPYTPFNSSVVKFRAKRPITYAVKLVDWEEKPGIGSEVNGANAYHPGDGGFMASFSDGTVTNHQWKAQSFYIAPLNDHALVLEQANGTHDSSAAGLLTPTLNQNSYALHYAVPSNWFAKIFPDTGWPAAATYSEGTVGVLNKPAYTNFPAQFSNSGAQFIWSSNLILDNEVIVRFTGPAAVQQIAIEQADGTPLLDGTGTVEFGSTNTAAAVARILTIRNNGSTVLSLTGATIDGTGSGSFSITSAPGATVAAGASTFLTLQFAPGSAGLKTAALHLASSDSSVGAAFDVVLRGTGFVPPPVITSLTTIPNTPTYLDAVDVTARLQAAAGASLTGAILNYSTGSQTTGPVFTETMAATATTPWTGAGTNNPWTVISLSGANAVRQLTTSNHGVGNPCGLQFDKGSVNLTDTMVTTATSINATGTAGYVEFWVSTTSMISPNGWTFQLSPDGGTTWTTRLSELTGNNHVFQSYRYDLLPAERTNNLRMGFQFAGYAAVAPTPAPKCNIDDITVVTTTGSAPVSQPMFDDGAHGDGQASDGVFGAPITAQVAGTVVTYTITAADNAGGITTSAPASSYTVNATPPAAGFTVTATTTSNGGVLLQWPAQPGFSYSAQWSPDLIHWNNVPVGQTNTWTDPLPPATIKRFYRVMR